MLWIDLETYSKTDIKGAGTYEYARTCDILLVAYALDDGPVRLWDRTKTPATPDDLFEALTNPETEYTAHNAMFDRSVLAAHGYALAGDPDRWSCTMCQAYLHGFTGSLDKLGEIFGLGADKAKMKDGKKLINRFCKPAPRNHKADRYDAKTHPLEWARFCEYAVRDVEAMRTIAGKLPRWNLDVKEYRLDQKINDRGFHVDLELAEAGRRAAIVEKAALAERFVELTNNDVRSPTQRAVFLEYINKRFGLELENTQRATLEPLLKKKIDPALAELITISINANKTSTSKYATLIPATSPDSRFRGGLQFSGAARTRRFSGRTFQPQNLPSRGAPKPKQIETYIDALKIDCHDILFDDELMRYGSHALRGVLIAPDGKKTCVADLANIEGRANAWLAGEEWKLEAFRDYDRGDGPDLYKVAAGKILGQRPQDVSKTNRDSFGKVTELALGYQGGVGAIQNFASNLGVAFYDHWDAIQQSVDEETIDRAFYNYETWGHERAGDLSQDEWIASETVKLSWRAAHPAISRLWYACEDAAINALSNPGKIFDAGSKLKFQYVRYRGNNYLLMRLPSSRVLVYCNPHLSDENKIVFWGVDSITKQWTKQSIYGGKFVENACQSLSRDILFHGMFEAEKRGYKTVLTVHDEVVTETPDTSEFSGDDLAEILSINPPWCRGFPLAAEGFEAYRYRK